MTINKKLNPKEIFNNMNEELAAINQGLEEGNLSKEDRKEIKKDLENVELQAYKAKFSVRLSILSEEQPDLTLKEVLVQMLDLLPANINPSFLPVLTNLVFENWANQRKIAA